MADNLGVNPNGYSTPDEGVLYPTVARMHVSDVAGVHLTDTYVVWFAYTLGNWKAMVSTKRPDGKYYEVTYDKAKGQTYVDVYEKTQQAVFPDEGEKVEGENYDEDTLMKVAETLRHDSDLGMTIADAHAVVSTLLNAGFLFRERT